VDNPLIFLNQLGYDKLYVESSNLSILRKVGKGISGVVYEATMAQNKVAVKCITMDQRDGKLHQRIRDFVSEISTIQKLNHPNLLHLIGVSFVRENELKKRQSEARGSRQSKASQVVDMLIVTDFCAMGTLQQLLLRKTATKLSLEIQVKIARELASGMAFTHGKKILHRDLKPDNVLLANEGTPPFTCKIADFGLAKAYGLDDFSKRSKTGDIGTPIFMAPGRLSNVGVLCYTRVTHVCPCTRTSPPIPMHTQATPCPCRCAYTYTHTFPSPYHTCTYTAGHETSCPAMSCYTKTCRLLPLQIASS
jgi:serine/threonine protein kinase